MNRLVSSLVIGLALLSAPAIAQESSSVALGARVRVQISPAAEPIIGKVVGLDAATLTLSIKGLASPTIVARNAITQIEVSRRRSRGRTALIGALTGLGFGALLGVAVTDQSNWLLDNMGENVAFFGLSGGAAGTLIGLVAGPGEDWWIPTSQVSTGSSALMRTPGVSASLTFRF